MRGGGLGLARLGTRTRTAGEIYANVPRTSHAHPFHRPPLVMYYDLNVPYTSPAELSRTLPFLDTCKPLGRRRALAKALLT